MNIEVKSVGKSAAGFATKRLGTKDHFHNERFAATQLYKEEQNIQSDQSIGDQRNSSARRIVITNWEHKVSPFTCEFSR
jgi:hypothetical protein